MKELLLITGAGGPAAINVYKSLKNEDVNIHLADADIHAAGLYFVEKEKRHILPFGNDETFLETLLTTCANNKVTLLIPTVDTELLPISENIERFEEIGVSVLLSDSVSLQNTLNKYLLLKHASATVNVGNFSMLYNSKEESFGNKKVVVKPIAGSGSRGVNFFNSYAEVPKELFENKELLIQERFDGPEYSVDMMMDKESNVVACAPRIRLKTDSGVSVTGKIKDNKAIIAYAEKVVKSVGLKYAANVQIFDSPEGPKLVEINPRFSGGLALSIRAGADTPKLGLALLQNKEVEKVTEIEEIAMVRFYEELYTKEL